jgi:hypothetical protein
MCAGTCRLQLLLPGGNAARTARRDAPEYRVLKDCGAEQQAANAAGRITCTVRARLEKTKVVMDASTHAFL